MTTPCPHRHHSPTFDGKSWSCSGCDNNVAQPEWQARISAAKEKGATVLAFPKRRDSKIPPEEYAVFVEAVKRSARDGLVRQNDVRPLVRGRIYHKHIGALWTWALSSGLLVELDREQSTDTAGRNSHHRSGVYRIGAAA